VKKIHIGFLSFLILLLVFSLQIGPISSYAFKENSSDPKFGFNVMNWTRLNWIQRPRVILLLKQLKVDWVRMPFPWVFIERKKGDPNFTKQDKMIDAMHKEGMKTLLFCGGSPPWAAARHAKGEAIPPRNPKDYANFLGVAAARYKGKGIAWEIWNEPNTPHYWGDELSTPEEYMKLLRPVYKAIKNADPDALVVGGCVLIQFMNEPKYSYLKGLLEKGLLDYCDIVSVHIYPIEREDAIKQFDDALSIVESMVREYGDHPIWLTELGLGSSRFAKEKATSLFKQKGLTEKQVEEVFDIPATKIIFSPLKEVPKILKVQLRLNPVLKEKLKKCNLTLDDLFEVSDNARVDTQKEQADLLEAAYNWSKKHRMFWFQLFDIAFSHGVVDKEYYVKQSFKRLKTLNQKKR